MADDDKSKPLTERIQTARREAGLLPDDDVTPAYGRGLSLGVELVVAVLLCAGGGALLDRWLESKPWFMLLGLLLGLAVGMWNLYRASLGAGLLSIGIKKDERGQRGD